MKKNNKKILTLIVSLIFILVIIALIILWIFEKKENERNGVVHCTFVTDNARTDNYYFLKNGKLLEQKNIIEQKNNSKEKIERYQKLIDKTNKDSMGQVSKLWVDEENMYIFEVFDFEHMELADLKELGFAQEDLQNLTKKKIIDNFIIINGENTYFKCD